MNFNYNESEYGEQFKNHLIEEYKLYVEMADRISQRRMDANSFYLSVNTLLVAFLTLFLKRNGDESSVLWIIAAVTGIISCGTWYFILKSYRQLNAGKFKVVHLMESKLPISPYDAEWKELGKGTDESKYWPLTHIEVILPILFFIIYITIILIR